MDEHLRNILKFNQSKVQYGAFEGLILPFLKNRSLVTLVGFRFHPCLPLAILGCHLSRCLSQTTQWQCRQHISRIILRGFRSPSEPVVSWQTFPFWTVFQGLQNRIIYSMDPKNFHPPSATLSCAPCEMGLQHVLHCTHPRSTMNCCPPPRIPKKYGYGSRAQASGHQRIHRICCFSDVSLYDLYDTLQFYCCQSYQHCDPTIQNIWQNGSDHPVIVELQPTGCFRQVEPLHDANVTGDSGR